MADSAEPSAELEAGRRGIEDLDTEIASVGPWLPSAQLATGEWQLELALKPKDLGDVDPIPPVTRWFVLADAEYPRGRIQIFPAKDGGIEETFPHQELNTPGDFDVPWRAGMLCLVHTISGHELAAARYDPITAYERLPWHVWRALEWLRAASRGELIKPGEPFELPVFGRRDTKGPIVAFRESADSFASWTGVSGRGGLAAIASVSDSGRRVVAARAFRDPRGRSVVDVPWGRHIAEAKESLGVWLRFEAMPVERYWRAPATWAELNAIARAQGFNAIDVVAGVADQIRDGRSHLVLVGFPISAVMGGEHCEYAWEAFELPALHRKGSKTAYPGFRADKALIVADRQIGALSPAATLAWVRTENWHPDHLAARGRFAAELSERRVVLVGAGALGSVVADMLVRGGVTDLAIIDGGVLEAGNLVRHTLSTVSVGMPKALALAARLNAVGPNASVTGFAESLPNLGSEARARIEAADLVIDTTGSDSVIASLGEMTWTSETTIASISLSFGAEKVYAFAARGPEFPAGEFREEIRPWSEADARRPDEYPWEGIGCWSSVFPARDDHVVQLAATAVAWLEGQVQTANAGPRFVVWERAGDGSVTRAATPVTA